MEQQFDLKCAARSDPQPGKAFGAI